MSVVAPVSTVLCDLDGVVWLARQAIPGSPEAVARLRASGCRVLFVTNNSVAVVGDPSRSSGFVLSRDPALGADQWSTVRDVVESRGWWPCAFLTVPMAGGRGDVTPLCLLP